MRANDACQRPDAAAHGLPIETIRGVAILLLVSFHVIGGAPEDGLGLSYPHKLRFFADLLVDVRMPLFGFVAGAVYALHPVERSQLGRFLLGKLRRLALPGVTAVTVFLVFWYVTGHGLPFAGHIWEAYFREYAVFWFLQVVLVFFFVFVPLDVLSRGRALVPALVLALVCVASGLSLTTDLMSLDRGTYLASYLLLGIFYVRHIETFRAFRRPVIALSLLGLAVSFWMNLRILQQTGTLSQDQLTLRSLVFSVASCLLAVTLLPRLRRLEWLGAFSLTIYLYHVLATSATRRILEGLGVESVPAHLVLGTAAGVLAPILLHLLMQSYPAARLLVLGLKPGSAASDAISLRRLAKGAARRTAAN